MSQVLSIEKFEKFVELLDNRINSNLDVLIGSLEKGLSNKHIEKFIKLVEKGVRTSPEYKIWTYMCKFGTYTCEFCGWSIHDGAKLEVHHTPVTLFEIVEDVILNKVRAFEDAQEPEEMKGKILIQDLVKEIVMIHLENNAEYVVICDCCHRKEHS